MDNQAIRAGFKQTEIGLIPEDWQVKNVGEVLKITTGSKNTQDRVDDGKYPFFVRSQKVEQINTYSFDGEGVLTAGDGVGTGKIFHYIRGKCDIHQRVYLMYDFSAELDGFYFFKFFSNNFYDRISSMTAKSSVDSVRKEMIADMKIVLPPLTEQTAIADALSDVDALIAELEKLIGKKQAIKTATMQQLLTGRTRLPQFATHPDGTPKGYKQTELGEIPEDWDVVRFESLCKIFTKQTGFDYSATIKPSLIREQRDGFLPFFQNKDFEGTVLNFDTDYFVPKEVALSFPRILLDEKCLLISISGKIGNVGLFNGDQLAFIGGAIAIAKFWDPKLLDWVMYYMLSDTGKNTLLRNVKAGSHQNLTLDDIRHFEIPVPTFREQQAITQICSDIDSEMFFIQKRLDKTRQLKQGMMQELLTGKTRLVKPEAAA